MHSYLECRSYLIHLVGVPLWTTVLEPPQIPGQMAEPRHFEEGLEARQDLLKSLDSPAIPEVSVPEDAAVTCQPTRTLFTRFSFIPVCPSQEITIPESDHPVVAPPMAADARGKGGGSLEFCRCHCVKLPKEKKGPERSPPAVDVGAEREALEEIVFPLPFPWDPAPPPEPTEAGVFAPGEETPMPLEERRSPTLEGGPTHSHGEQSASEAVEAAGWRPNIVVVPRDLRPEPVFGRPTHVGETHHRPDLAPPLFDIGLAPFDLAERVRRHQEGRRTAPQEHSRAQTRTPVQAGTPLHPDAEHAMAIVPPHIVGGLP